MENGNIQQTTTELAAAGTRRSASITKRKKSAKQKADCFDQQQGNNPQAVCGPFSFYFFYF